MVTEVQAWADASGKIHRTHLEALEADAIAALGKLDCFNIASATAIVKRAHELIDVLEPLAAEQRNKQALAEVHP